MPAPPAKQADFLRALAESTPGDIERLYWYARVTLLSDIAALAVFDRVFDAWFRGGDTAIDTPPADESDVPAPGDQGGRALPATEAQQGSGAEASAAPVITRRRDFRGPDAGELTRRLRTAFVTSLPALPSRRRRPAAAGRVLDMRRTLRQARRTGGEIAELCWTTRPRRPRRLLILLDVSGSLKEHTPQLLRLAHAAPARTEVFTFGTRLTRITRALAAPDVQRALDAVSDIVPDADGGTAIGAAMLRFQANPRFLALSRGAVIVVISDGLERGDCTAMIGATERFGRLGHRLIWWSPLAVAPGYRPVTRGMSGLLGHLDHLGGVRDLESGLAEVNRIPAVTAGPRRAAWRRWT